MSKFSILALLAAGLANAGSVPSQQIRAAVKKAVPLLQSVGYRWFEKQTCTSCHHQALTTMAVAVAREHGVAMDDVLLRRTVAKAWGYLNQIDQSIQYSDVINPPDDGIRLVAAHEAGIPSSITLQLYALHIARRQRDSGEWFTIDERPPSSYSRFSATAIAMHATQLYMHPRLASEAGERVERARHWLLTSKPQDTEDRTFQLLGLGWAGADRSIREGLAAQLLVQQRPDGGWAQMPALTSDAYSTGEVLFALHEMAGVPANSTAYQRGVRYLLDTQKPDGSWFIETRLHPPAPVSPPYFESGFPYGHSQFISCAGTSWAVMALALALDRQPVVDRTTIQIPEITPPATEPWVETALFGSAADLHKLLGNGLDANSKTAGGTTLLMMAVPDIDKVKLLLARGADVNARSKVRYTALMVACQFRGAAPAVRELLAHGADMKSEPRALFNASPQFLAAFAGDIETAGLLFAKGANPGQRMLLGGLLQYSPLHAATLQGDADMVKYLIEHGAEVNEQDADGITALGWAAINGFPEVTRVLIQLGADVDHVDKLGMTPLLYAASVDFGTTDVVDVLAKSGANLKARNKDGYTALDLARRYKHSGIARSLESTKLTSWRQ